MKKLLVIPVVILLLALGVIAAACGSSSSGGTSSSSSPSAAAQTTPIKVGHIIDLTGAEAVVGKEMKTSLAYAFQSVGNQIDGRPVQIIVADGGGSAATAIQDAKQMVEVDHVAAIFGPTEISEKIAVANYCKQVGVPMLTYDPTPPFVFQGNKYVFGVGGTTVQPTSCMGDYLYKHLGYKTIDTLAEAGSAGHAFVDPLVAEFEKDGGKVVQQLWPTPDINDYSSYLTTLKPANCVVAWVTGSSAITLLTQYHQLGIDKKMPIAGAFHGGFLDPFIPAAMSPANAASVIGDMAPMGYAPDSTTPENQAFVAGFTKAMGFPPGDDGASGPYQAAMVFIQAVKDTNGNTDSSVLTPAIAATKIVGPQGPTSFAAGQQAATMDEYILKVAKVPGVKNAYHYVTVYTYQNVSPNGYGQ
ncbi:MAG: ABC transporter substrate-binding protein [Acidobacteriota bacterium]